MKDTHHGEPMDLPARPALDMYAALAAGGTSPQRR